jgi:hypothetical protein
MIEKNEKDMINDNINTEKSFKAFNIIKDIQNLLKKEANYKNICRFKNIFINFIL